MLANFPSILDHANEGGGGYYQHAVISLILENSFLDILLTLYNTHFATTVMEKSPLKKGVFLFIASNISFYLIMN